MAHVITEPCNDCKFTDCVEVCPVNCFYEGDNRLFINPDECIDCRACVPVCPVEAIFAEEDTPDKWKSYIQVNRDATTGADKDKHPNLTEKKAALAENAPPGKCGK